MTLESLADGGERFTTAGGIAITRRRDTTPYGGAIERYIDALDSRRGAVFSSNYEYPGRYTRWDTAIIDPPLAITANGRAMRIEALNRVLPPGFDVVTIVEAGGRPLHELLEASWWTIELPGVDPAVLAQLAGILRDAEQVEVTRMTKKGERRFDVRAGLIKVWASEDGLEVVVRHSEPLVRPDDVVAALRLLAPDVLSEIDAPLATRRAQGPLIGDEVGDPLA